MGDTLYMIMGAIVTAVIIYAAIFSTSKEPKYHEDTRCYMCRKTHVDVGDTCRRCGTTQL